MEGLAHELGYQIFLCTSGDEEGVEQFIEITTEKIKAVVRELLETRHRTIKLMGSNHVCNREQGVGLAALGGKCIVCGSVKDLTFHHRIPWMRE